MSVIQTTTGRYTGEFTLQDQIELSVLQTSMPFRSITVTQDHASLQTVITFVGPAILFIEPQVQEWLNKLSFVEKSYDITPEENVKKTDFHLEPKNGNDTVFRVVLDNGRRLRNPINMVYVPSKTVWVLLVGKQIKNYSMTLSGAMSNISDCVQEEMI